MTSIIPKVSNLSSRIIRVLGCNPGPMTLQGTNTYIIGTGKRRVLLDTGEHDNSEYLSSLAKTLEEHSISLEYIIISHWHHDHIGGLDGILNNICKPSKILKFPRLDASDPPLETGQELLHTLKDKDEISTEGATLRIHHTPGHTTDHVVVELKEENCLFSADCILGEGTAVFEELYSYMKSLQAILDIAPTIIYPGHGPVINEPLKKIKHYIDHRNEREQQILSVLSSKPDCFFTPLDIVKVVYTDTPTYLFAAAASNVRHHLEKLEKEEMATRSSESGEDTWRLSSKNHRL